MPPVKKKKNRKIFLERLPLVLIEVYNIETSGRRAGVGVQLPRVIRLAERRSCITANHCSFNPGLWSNLLPYVFQAKKQLIYHVLCRLKGMFWEQDGFFLLQEQPGMLHFWADINSRSGSKIFRGQIPATNPVVCERCFTSSACMSLADVWMKLKYR